jgi:hypothetical protein
MPFCICDLIAVPVPVRFTCRQGKGTNSCAAFEIPDFRVFTHIPYKYYFIYRHNSIMKMKNKDTKIEGIFNPEHRGRSQ